MFKEERRTNIGNRSGKMAKHFLEALKLTRMDVGLWTRNLAKRYCAPLGARPWLEREEMKVPSYSRVFLSIRNERDRQCHLFRTRCACVGWCWCGEGVCYPQRDVLHLQARGRRHNEDPRRNADGYGRTGPT